MSEQTENKKKTVIAEIFEICEKKGDMVFDNTLVKKVCKKHDFKNPFDATKLDNTDKLPEILKQKDYFVLHLGEGKHQFVKGIRYGYHDFEKINEDEHIEWKYRKSILNEVDESESNIISVGINQRILHDFLYDDMVASPKFYGAKRTKSSFAFRVGQTKVKTKNVQMEMDATLEYLGQVTVIEGKNEGSTLTPDFAVYQIYYPFRYFMNIKERENLPIENINCLYLMRNKERNLVKLYLYSFEDPGQIGSIKLLKKAAYHLIRR